MKKEEAKTTFERQLNLCKWESVKDMFCRMMRTDWSANSKCERASGHCIECRTTLVDSEVL